MIPSTENDAVNQAMRQQEYINVLGEGFQALRLRQEVGDTLTEAELEELDWIRTEIIATYQALHPEAPAEEDS